MERKTFFSIGITPMGMLILPVYIEFLPNHREPYAKKVLQFIFYYYLIWRIYQLLYNTKFLSLIFEI